MAPLYSPYKDYESLLHGHTSIMALYNHASYGP
jgi:hypothetical protein